MVCKKLKKAKFYLLKVPSNFPANDIVTIIEQLEQDTQSKVVCIYNDMEIEPLTKRTYNFLKRMLNKRRRIKNEKNTSCKKI